MKYELWVRPTKPESFKVLLILILVGLADVGDGLVKVLSLGFLTSNLAMTATFFLAVHRMNVRNDGEK